MNWFTKLIIALVVGVISIVFTIYSCSKYQEAMSELNKNPDYIESEILDDASDNISSASSELEYIPERIWTESHRICTHTDEDGFCTSHSTYFDTHRRPEDCPDIYDAKKYIKNAISLLEKTGGIEYGINDENAAPINKLRNVSSPLPDGNELCFYRDYHVSESTFARERNILESIDADIEAHEASHYELVPSDLKSKRNWSIFGLIVSIVGIVLSVCVCGFIVVEYSDERWR
jgi:hypothetical protein